MSFMDHAREALAKGSDEQWIYNRSKKLLIELNLGSGVRLEVVYYTDEDISIDNIETATLFENGQPKQLCEEDLQVLEMLDII